MSLRITHLQNSTRDQGEEHGRCRTDGPVGMGGQLFHRYTFCCMSVVVDVIEQLEAAKDDECGTVVLVHEYVEDGSAVIVIVVGRVHGWDGFVFCVVCF